MINTLLNKAKWRFRMGLKNILLGWQPLESSIGDGLPVKIESYVDWILFSDIFLTGEYDEAIEAAFLKFEKSGRSLMQIADIGANVGFFSLRFAQLFQKRFGESRVYKIHLFEGSPQTATILSERIQSSELLAKTCQIHLGLVGQRSGRAKIYQLGYHGMNSLVPRRFTKSADVPFLDLEELLDDQPIDLLKCDIEGSEQAFFENYPDLLSRTQLAVIELHHTFCDTVKCRALLDKAGLSVFSTTPERTGTTVDIFSRLEPRQR